MRYMTGSRFSRVKHSTGGYLENGKPRNGVRGMRYSTGRDSRALHATGVEFDMTAEDPELAVTAVTIAREELTGKKEESRRRLQEAMAMAQDTERELVEVGVDR